MVRISNIIFGVVNLATLVVSVVAIGAASYYNSHRAADDYLRFLQWPVIITGLAVMVLSLFGLFGSLCRASLLLRLYLFVNFLASLLLFCFIIFSLLFTNQALSRRVSGWAINDHNLPDYYNLMRDRVHDSRKWEEIVVALREARVCTAEDGDRILIFHPAKFYRQNLAWIQSGCCKPPAYCGYNYQNGTYWTVPDSGLISEDVDCTKWSNDGDILCYGCNACKVGVLHSLTDGRKRAGIYLFLLLVFVNIVYSIGCCALHNNRVDMYQKI